MWLLQVLVGQTGHSKAVTLHKYLSLISWWQDCYCGFLMARYALCAVIVTVFSAALLLLRRGGFVRCELALMSDRGFHCVHGARLARCSVHVSGL